MASSSGGDNKEKDSASDDEIFLKSTKDRAKIFGPIISPEENNLRRSASVREIAKKFGDVTKRPKTIAGLYKKPTFGDTVQISRPSTSSVAQKEEIQGDLPINHTLQDCLSPKNDISITVEEQISYTSKITEQEHEIDSFMDNADVLKTPDKDIQNANVEIKSENNSHSNNDNDNNTVEENSLATNLSMMAVHNPKEIKSENNSHSNNDNGSNTVEEDSLANKLSEMAVNNPKETYNKNDSHSDDDNGSDTTDENSLQDELSAIVECNQKPLKLWHKGRLNTEVLKQVLLRSEIANLPVVVLAVAGEYRTGKSFLLCYILRYLKYLVYRTREEEQKDKNGWIGDSHEPLQGFQHRNTREPVTTGIDIWSEPFIIENKGHKVVIILMDTQGIFDNKHKEEESKFIFSFSIMVSSIFVFNIPRNLNDHHHIGRLKKFTEYAEKCSSDNGLKDFQKLMFLVRDWEHSHEFNFGNDGGKQMLEDYLKEDVADPRMFIRDTWEEIGCYLMPHPGNNVTEQKDYNGNFAALRNVFQTHLKRLIEEELLSQDKLVSKRISGSKITAEQLYLHIKSTEEYIENFMKIRASFISDQARIKEYNDFKEKITDFVELNELPTSEKQFDDDVDTLYKLAEHNYDRHTNDDITVQFPDIIKETKEMLRKDCSTIRDACLDIYRKKTKKKHGNKGIKKLIKRIREQSWWNNGNIRTP